MQRARRVTFSAFPVEEHLLGRVLIQKGAGCATSGCVTAKLGRALDVGTSFSMLLQILPTRHSCEKEGEVRGAETPPAWVVAWSKSVESLFIFKSP